MVARVVAFVPIVALKDIFSQQEVSRRRCRWINRIQEFNINTLRITHKEWSNKTLSKEIEDLLQPLYN